MTTQQKPARADDLPLMLGASGHADNPFRLEEARLRSAYARRSEDDRYSWFTRAHLLMMQDRERRVLALLERHGFRSLRNKQILDVGCGTGQWIRDFIKWGATPDTMIGVDLLPARLAEARRMCPEAVTLHCVNGSALPVDSQSMDLVIQSTAFTSILDHEMRVMVAREMVRVVKPDGLVVWYDYHVNNPRNPDVRAVKKRELRQLFPGCRVALSRITLAPPLARFVAPRSPLVYAILERVPFLCTHYLGAIQRGR